jgi:two-component system, chemotaxis family, chemotaxis protein CheY
MLRILVVDDSDLMHSLMKYALGRLKNAEASFAKNGKEALDFLTSNGEPSLILLDINMPVMDGLELLRRLTTLGVTQRVPVIIVSTEGKEADVLRGLEAGARAYLPKPFKAQDLHTMIERVLS